MKKQRIASFDAAKLLALLCIAAGHTVNGKPPLASHLFFSFDVPIFFLISGYFFKPVSDTNAYLKRIARLYLVPYGVTCALMCGIAMLQSLLRGKSVLPAFTRWLDAAIYGSGSKRLFPLFSDNLQVIGAIWFLLALFWASLLLHLIDKFAQKTPRPPLTMVLCVASIAYIGYYTAKACWLPLSIQAGMTALAFLYIGQQARRAKLFCEWNFPPWLRGLMLCVWLFYVQYYGRLYMVENVYSDGWMDVLGALCGSYCVLELCRIGEKHCPRLLRLLACGGRFTLPMLCVHILEMNLLNYQAHIFPFVQRLGLPISWPVAVLCRIIIVFSGTALLSVIPFINRLFGFHTFARFHTRKKFYLGN